MTNAADLRKIVVTIPSGQTTSTVANISRGLLTGIRFPSAMTSTTYKIQNCPDSGSEVSSQEFRDCLDGSNADILSSLTISTTKDILLDTSLTPGLGFIRIVVGSAEAADRQIVLTFKQAS